MNDRIIFLEVFKDVFMSCMSHTLSGCREFLPAGRQGTQPSRTLATLEISLFGEPRIGLGPHAPETCVLPLYYSPTISNGVNVRTTDILHPVFIFLFPTPLFWHLYIP